MYQGWVGLIKAVEPDMPANTGDRVVHNGFPVAAAGLSGLGFASQSLEMEGGCYCCSI